MSLDVLFAQLTSTRFYGDSALFQSDDFKTEESRTYNWDGAKMSAGIDEPIPIVYGRHIVSPNLINVYIEEGEFNTLNMLLGLCEGEIESISNIKVNGASIDNFLGETVNDPYSENAEVSVRYGTLNQSAISNFGDIHNIYPVIQNLKKGVPFVYTTINPNVEAFKIEFRINQLFQKTDSEDTLSWYVSVQIEYRVHGALEWTFAGIHEFTKKTETTFTRYFKSEYLFPAKYDIRVTRVSDNSDDYHKGEIELRSVDEIITENLIYPATALLGIRLVASEKISGDLPNVTCVVTGKKVTVPDVRDGDGSLISWEDYYWNPDKNAFCSLAHPDLEYLWDGSYIIAWSANPVWCLRDLLLNKRYGLGDFIKEQDLNDESFLQAAKYSEEGVLNMDNKLEKRIRLDIVLDTEMNAIDAVLRVCSVFRGLLHISSGKIRLVIEKQEAPVFTFNMSNLVRDSFGIKYLSDKAIPNVLQLHYTNKDKDYRRDVIEVGDESAIAQGEKIRTKSIQFFGCTRISQALRESRILLKKLKSNTRQIAFRTGMDAFTCQVGDVFGFQHDLPAWGQGGRVRIGCTQTKIKVDKTVVLELGKTYEIEIRHIESDKIEKRTISNPDGSYSEVSVSIPFSFNPTEYDLWTFGEQNYTNKKYRVISIDRGFDGVISISAIEYNANVYDYSGITLPKDEFRYLTLEIPNVSNLTVVEKATRLADGTIDDILNVSYSKPPISARWVKRVFRFEIYLSDNNGASWNFIGITDKEFFTIKEPFTNGLRYTVAVVSVTEEGESRVPSNSPQVSITIEGWKKPPAQVRGFTYTFEDEITLTWEKNLESDVAGYEIRIESYNWGNVNDKFVWRGNAISYTIIRPSARSGIIYYIKAYNTSGVFSDTYSYLTPQNPAPEALSLTYTSVFQKAFLTWQDSTDKDLVGYEVWQNDIDIWKGFEFANEKLVHKSQGTSAMMLVPYNPTYFRIRGIDRFGPGEWSNSIRVFQITIEGVDISPNSIDSVHILDDSIIAPKIAAGAIQSGHISAHAITAEKILVGQLSAISADLGSISAGLLIGTCIKTSNQLYRTELNNAGLFSYDSNGVMTIKLSDGGLCLINPDAPAFYSFIDHGALKFKYPYGSMPYAKRICSGVACAGSTITLCQWYEKPEVEVGIRKLMAYNSSHAESCQDWCVYADNFRWFDYSGSNFGWKFDVHAKLVLSGGTRPECIYLVNFDTTEPTGVDTCLVLVKEMFQLWCHGYAPDTFKYGIEDFEVRYRVQGCGVWCSSSYQYVQPHGTVSEITTTNVECQTIHLGSGTIYEVQLHRNNLNWYDSGIQSGITCCYLCCFQYCCASWVTCYIWCCYSCQVDCSYWQTCSIVGTGKSFSYQAYWNVNHGTYHCTYTDYATFPAWSSGCDICNVQIVYDICGCLCTFLHLEPFDGFLVYSEVYDSKTGTRYRVCATCKIHSVPDEFCGVCNFSGHIVQNVGTAYMLSYSFDTTLHIVFNACWSGYGCAWATGIAVSNVYQNVCYKQCAWCTCYYGCWVPVCCQVWCVYWCCYWYTCYYGDPATCIYEKFYSMTETTSFECILDPYGQINYLAVAYA